MAKDYKILAASDYNVRAQIAAALDDLSERIDKVWADSVALFTAAAYGGIVLKTPTALPDIGAGWTTLLFDTPRLTTPRHVIQDFANNGIRFDHEGIYSINIAFTISHNENNSSRTIEVRLFNVTDGISGESTVIGISRNQPVTNFAAQMLADIGSTDIGDLVVVQVGNGDTLLNVVDVAASFNATSVSEFKE